MTHETIIVGLILSPLISVLLGVFLSNPIRRSIAYFSASVFRSKKDGPIGVWEATFLHGPEKKEYVEVIELTSSFGIIYGRVISDKANYEAVKSELIRKNLSSIPRLKGRIEHNRHFTGEWYHPLWHSHYHGAFHLLLDTGGEVMNGMWLGYSENRNAIEAERWNWKRRVSR